MQARLRTYRAQMRAVAVSADAALLADPGELAQLRTAAAELGGGLSRLLGTNVSASCCAAKAAGNGAGTLAMTVGAVHRALGTEASASPPWTATR